MTARILKSIAALRHNERGASLIEFAFIAPIFAMMLVGLADISRGIIEKFALQQAVSRTMERANLGSSDDTYSFLAGEAAEAASDAGAPDATVTIDRWIECDGTKKAWTDSCTSGQQIARYLTLRISTNFVPMFSSAGFPGATSSGVPISAKASLRVQ